MRWKRTLGVPEQLLPTRHVAVLHRSQLLEQLTTLGHGLSARERSVEKSRVALIAVMLVPACVGYGPLGSFHKH